MSGAFIVSLDCEGKWGMADHLDAWHHRHLNRTELVAAYRTLLDLFRRYEIPASFAFVMALLLSPDEQAEMAEWFADTEIEGANWLRAFRDAQAANDLEGWSRPELLDMVRESRVDGACTHEIACHGFTHLPLAENLVERSDVSRELAACAEVAQRKGLTLETFVYPRNLEGYPEALAEAGYAGYRARPAQRGKLGLFAAEMNPFDRAQRACPDQVGLTVIPSGEMLNWQSGPRKLVPRAASKRRWASRLEDAARTGGVAHIWLHPHNIIDAGGTLERLEDVLAVAARLRDAGRLDTVTQAEYCARSGT